MARDELKARISRALVVALLTLNPQEREYYRAARSTLRKESIIAPS